MQKTRLVFCSPSLSKATLGDIFDSVVASNRAFSVDTTLPNAELSSDPATIAIIAAAGVTVSSVIQAVTQVFLQRKQAQIKKADESAKPSDCSVTLRISGTMGESWSITISNPEQIGIQIAALPSDPDEIRRIRLD